MKIIKIQKKLLYPELSYNIIGALFDVYNQLKYGHREKIYQKALAEQLSEKKINFQREQHYPVKFNNKVISHYYVDFLVEDKVVLELKVAEDFYQKDINQTLAYLKFRKLELGILAIFAKNGIKYKRILNLIREDS